MKNNVENIHLARYYRALAEAEMSSVFARHGMKARGLRVDGSTVWLQPEGDHDEVRICKCMSPNEAAGIAHALKERFDLLHGQNDILNIIAGLMRSLSFGLMYFMQHEKPTSVDMEHFQNAGVDRLQVVAEYDEDIAREMLTPFIHRGRFSLAHHEHGRRQGRTFKMIEAAEELIAFVRNRDPMCEELVTLIDNLEESMKLGAEDES